MKDHFFYRLYEPKNPEITRYIGMTIRPELRLYAHAMQPTGLNLPWINWLWPEWPRMEIIDHRTVVRQDARKIELDLIQSHASNQWLLNKEVWKRDKVNNGIPKNIVNAYHALMTEVCGTNASEYAARQLEELYPRLKLFPHWGVRFHKRGDVQIDREPLHAYVTYSTPSSPVEGSC